jgi:hypothetical protein
VTFERERILCCRQVYLKAYLIIFTFLKSVKREMPHFDKNFSQILTAVIAVRLAPRQGKEKHHRHHDRGNSDKETLPIASFAVSGYPKNGEGF